jgi:DNA-binding transcriptional MerR regulator
MYSISELAEKSGLSKRTIHYYVKLGLLPNPGTRGPSTRYQKEYIDRIRLIKILKANHHPLEEIALLLKKIPRREIARLAAQSDEEVYKAIGHDDVRTSIRSSKEAMREEDASEYIENVLNLTSPPLEKSNRVKSQIQMFNAPPPTSAWERHSIIQGVEIHVDSAISADSKEKLAKLITFAKNLFTQK